MRRRSHGRRERFLPGYEGRGQHPFGLLFFDPRMQELRKGWARALLRTPDAATGRALADEPAVAAIEVQDEDSLLFWTFRLGETIPLPRIAGLERSFGGWVAGVHGSCEKALAAWGGTRLGRDDPAGGRMELLPAWNLTEKGHGEGGARRRASDQLRFLAEVQRRFHDEAVSFLRKDLDSKSLVVCGNWHTADPRVLDGIERWTYTAGDLLDQHGYFGGNAQGDAAAWTRSPGPGGCPRPEWSAARGGEAHGAGRGRDDRRARRRALDVAPLTRKAARPETPPADPGRGSFRAVAPPMPG